MSEPTLNFHVQAGSTQFKVPTELIRKNFKTIQKLIEKQKRQAANDIANIKKNPSLPTAIKLEMIRKIIRSFEALEKKLKASINKDQEYRSRLLARLENLQELTKFTVTRNHDQDITIDMEDNEHAIADDLEDEDPKSVKTKARKSMSGDEDKALDLHNPTLINWYRDQANLLIIDYLIKSNVSSEQSVGLKLLQSLSVSNPKYMKLIDYDLYETLNKVFLSIVEHHDLSLVIAWFEENRTALKKANSNIEFEINYCKFLSFIEEGRTDEAIKFSQVHLSPSGNINNYQENEHDSYLNNLKKLKEIGGLLVYLAINEHSSPSQPVGSFSTSMVKHSARFHDYEKLLSDDRWIFLSECFMENFTKLYGISRNFPLFIYLSAGLSSLKTKSCYCNNDNTIFVNHKQPHEEVGSLKDRKYRGPNHYYKRLNRINNCPVCSPELFKLSRNLPYAQLITSIFNNPYKLPNGNIYPIDKLTTPSSLKNSGSGSSIIEDPLTKEVFALSECVRVYPA
ncbi:GID complex subunit containing RING finger motif [Yamadazyma tenuis]|uniref:Uncharacterized protein n=1 Tax=Candida tenuis (strain ATCC 10573 / BCRC 21748 / CBS 615 / JCM 9827 / NBRC 10315 / NRRL Y-1498 / VKM Y-70) TaxID=590646 RepID=G3BBX6_CANTC|nr:uncharacterized protein CANTEDRAFT_126985 [Yamadazyma tenuis ATCC 10573]EGV60106.1 hypothetical protein CANTEDRAFT_126985 [Yamadazyma tenuis ATCC 10573]WEJ94660.1 GID complex subunit containing RING finger motif [Yamadazyma tenuis]